MSGGKIAILTAFIALFATVTILVAYVIIDPQEEENVIVSTPAPEKKEPAPEPEPEPTRSLLTNEPIDEDLLTQRPVAVMIENTKAALPLYGIRKAGIIYECPVEGGITRFMALYDQYRHLKKIGNLRSCRPYYVYLAAEYDAIYMHFGQSIQGKELLETGIIDDLNGIDGDVFNNCCFQTKDRKRPHNSYTSGDGIHVGIDLKQYEKHYRGDYDEGHFIFAGSDKDNITYTGDQVAEATSGNALSEGKKCEVICPYFRECKPYFVYDKKTRTYKRFEYGEPMKDAAEKKQMDVTNIIFMNVESSLYEETANGAGYLNIPLIGGGDGKFFTNGRMVDITWYKDDDTEPTVYNDDTGMEIRLNTGRTWICLIEESHLDENRFYKTKKEFKNGEKNDKPKAE